MEQNYPHKQQQYQKKVATTTIKFMFDQSIDFL